ncbi:MAG: glycosyltransferase family 2 protein [Eubacterium sp.]|nr:glycosyltransferase family 2 protein [Eubacterium sp.]
MNITIGIVARNEEHYLPRILEDVKSQDYPHEKIEVLLVDGRSTDDTKNIMNSFADEAGDFLSVRIFDNEKIIQSTGWNIAIENFSTDALVRIDAHARIEKSFISACVTALGATDTTDEKYPAEYVVGGARPTINDGETGWSETLHMAEESMFGSSILSSRRTADHEDSDEIEPEPVEKRNYVNTLFHACYRREVLEKVGGFREDLRRTEDNEFHYRIRKKGYRIYMSPFIHSSQYIRPSLGTMLKQKFGNGLWIGRTLFVCPGCLSLYHFVPFAFVMAILASTALAICGFTWCISLLAALYFSAAILMSIASAFIIQKKGGRVPAYALLLPLIFFALHTIYGIGTLVGLVSHPFISHK